MTEPSDEQRRALIDHTARTTRFSRDDIEAALAITGPDPDVWSLAEHLARCTGQSPVMAALALSMAVDSFAADDDDQPPHVDGQDELFPDPRTTTEVPF